MDSEQAAQQLQLIQSMYSQTVELNSRAVGLFTLSSFLCFTLVVLVVLVILFGVPILGLLRPKRNF